MRGNDRGRDQAFHEVYILPYIVCQKHQTYINSLIQQITDLRNISSLIKYLNTYLGQSQVLRCGWFEKGLSINLLQTPSTSQAIFFPSGNCDNILRYFLMSQIVVFHATGIQYGGADDANKDRTTTTSEINLQQTTSCAKIEKRCSLLIFERAFLPGQSVSYCPIYQGIIYVIYPISCFLFLPISLFSYCFLVSPKHCLPIVKSQNCCPVP